MADSTALRLVRGTDLTLNVQVVDPVTSLPMNLTGAAAYLTIKELDSSTSAAASLSTAVVTEAAIPFPQSGVVEFYFTPAKTSGLAAPKTYRWEVQVVLGGKTWAAVASSPLDLLMNLR